MNTRDSLKSLLSEEDPFKEAFTLAFSFDGSARSEGLKMVVKEYIKRGQLDVAKRKLVLLNEKNRLEMIELIESAEVEV